MSPRLPLKISNGFQQVKKLSSLVTIAKNRRFHTLRTFQKSEIFLKPQAKNNIPLRWFSIFKLGTNQPTLLSNPSKFIKPVERFLNQKVEKPTFDTQKLELELFQCLQKALTKFLQGLDVQVASISKKPNVNPNKTVKSDKECFCNKKEREKALKGRDKTQNTNKKSKSKKKTRQITEDRKITFARMTRKPPLKSKSSSESKGNQIEYEQWKKHEQTKEKLWEENKNQKTKPTPSPTPKNAQNKSKGDNQSNVDTKNYCEQRKQKKLDKTKSQPTFPVKKPSINVSIKLKSNEKPLKQCEKPSTSTCGENINNKGQAKRKRDKSTCRVCSSDKLRQKSETKTGTCKSQSTKTTTPNCGSTSKEPLKCGATTKQPKSPPKCTPTSPVAKKQHKKLNPGNPCCMDVKTDCKAKNVSKSSDAKEPQCETKASQSTSGTNDQLKRSMNTGKICPTQTYGNDISKSNGKITTKDATGSIQEGKICSTECVDDKLK